MTRQSSIPNVLGGDGELQNSPHCGRLHGPDGEYPDLRRGAYRPPATRLSASQPHLPSTIPESIDGKMNTSGSQSQEDTQPVSQSFYYEFQKRIKQQHAAKESGLPDGVSGTAKSVSHTYHEGQTGHIDLLGVYDQQTVAHSQTSVEERNNDDIEPATQAADVRADIYPESERFRLPSTPSTDSKKHSRAGETIDNPSTTPRLPINPFAGQMGGLNGLMDASQLFNATQALSSPLINVIPSDGLSERPSPDMFSRQRPSTGDHPLSSPAKLPRLNMVRSVTEPQATYISLKESQAERERLARMSLVGLGAVGQELSDDDDFDFDSQLRRHRLRRKIDQETNLQFMGITAPPTPVQRGHPRGYKGRQNRAGNFHRRSSRETSEAVIISDDIPAEDPHSNGTEEETEREEESNSMDIDDEADDLADDNKENVGTKGVQVPMTDSRMNYRTSLATTTQSSPSHRIQGSAATPHVPGQAGGRDHESTAITDVSEGVPLPTQTVAIADSQSSQSHVEAKTSHNTKMQSRAPGSPLDPPLLIPQPQLDGPNLQPSNSANGGAHVRSPAEGSVAPVSSPGRGESPPSHLRGSSDTSTLKNSKLLPENGLPVGPQIPELIGSSPPVIFKQQKVLEPTREGTNIVNGDGIALPRTEASAEEIPRSATTTVAQGRGASPDRRSDNIISHQQTTYTMGAQDTIAETSSAVEGIEVHTHAVVSSAGSGSKPLPDTLPGHCSKGSTVFETAQSHLSIQATQSSARPTELSPQNGFADSPKLIRPRTITEIAAAPSPGTPSDDVDLDINLLTSGDVEYQTVIDQLSPVRKKRRGNHGQALRAAVPEPPPPTPQAPIHPTMANDERPMARSSEPIMPQPPIENGSTKTVALNMTQGVNDNTDERIETQVKVKSSPRGRPRKIKPITTSKIAEALTNGTKTQGTAVTASSLRVVRGPPPQEPIAQPIGASAVAATRVFAHFNGNCAAYYPATCIGVVGGQEPRYRVRFDDGTVDMISGYGIRRLELRPGDNVKLDIGGARTNNYVVESTQDQQLPTPLPDSDTPTRRGRPRLSSLTTYPQTDIYGHITVVVSLKQRKSLDGDHHNKEKVYVPVKHVYLTQTMWTNFRNRDYTHATALDQGLDRLGTPSERPSTPSTPCSRTRRVKNSGFSKSLSTSLSARSGGGLFENMAFAVTNVNDVEDHSRVTQQILSNGGRILNAGFGELFHIPYLDISSPSKNSPTESQFQTNQAASSLGFTCLIADEHCRRAKYIEALALGIPCLATRWIQDSITKRRILPWIPYLLASGESTYLGGAVHSRFLQPYPAETATLSTILETRSKLLHDQSVLLIMSNREEKTMKSHPLITHALGASKVSRALNIDVAAKAIAEAQANGEPWNWVYSHDNEKEVERRLFGGGEKAGRKRKRGRGSDGVTGASGEKGGTRVVGNEFVIQSLILGMLVDGE